jgi:hypothetical protein
MGLMQVDDDIDLFEGRLQQVGSFGCRRFCSKVFAKCAVEVPAVSP